MITFGSLFSGIGGIDLGLERAGMVCKWQSEIDVFCRRVLKKHWPGVPLYGDVRDIGAHNLERVDLIAGGVPCQDVSIVGSRKGLEGERSTLWREYYRVVRELEPRWVLVENVRGLLSSDDGRFFGEILGNLADSGYDAEWQMLPAAAFGAPHVRERIFLVANSNSIRLQGGSNDGGSQTKRAQRKQQLSGLVQADCWMELSERELYREGNGFSGGVDRLRALGNAVVPQVAEWLGRRIIEADGKE